MRRAAFCTMPPCNAMYAMYTLRVFPVSAQVLSKAFRNRFLEMHVGDIPDDELAAILQHRCQVRSSFACATRLGSVLPLKPVRREETFFPRMIDADSKKADRASPLERFNLASTSDRTC